MNLNGVLIGSQDPQRLTAYYTSLFGEPGLAGRLVGALLTGLGAACLLLAP